MLEPQLLPSLAVPSRLGQIQAKSLLKSGPKAAINGQNQTKDLHVDHEETFLPTARVTAISSLGVNKNSTGELVISTLDPKKAHIN